MKQKGILVVVAKMVKSAVVVAVKFTLAVAVEVLVVASAVKV
jgi:hypothetical protein